MDKFVAGTGELLRACEFLSKYKYHPNTFIPQAFESGYMSMLDPIIVIGWLVYSNLPLRYFTFLLYI